MHCLSFVFMVVFTLSIALSAQGQIYEYRDADGNIRFTDDLGNVPASQRENVKRVQSIPVISPQEVREDSSDETEGLFRKAGDVDKTGMDLFEMGEALRREQSELQAKYDSIEEARAVLGDGPGKGASPEERDEYGADVDTINEKIKEYQKRLVDFEKRAEAYNARFEQ